MTTQIRRGKTGPARDPDSERSRRDGYQLTALPASPCDDAPPPWPLAKYPIWRMSQAGNKVHDEAKEKAWKRREERLWRWLWSQPQARAWHRPEYGYMLMELAQWTRLSALCETDRASAADRTVLLRIGDRIGLTPAGMTQLGWKIAVGGEAAACDETARESARESVAEASKRREADGGPRIYQRRMSNGR